MNEPYYQDEAVTIYHGNCRELLPLLTADLCFDDPPYLEGNWWSFYPSLRRSSKRLVVTPGAVNAYEWTQRVRPYWTYAWVSATRSLGGAACLHIGWEPVLAFNKPVMPLATDLLKFPISMRVGVGDHPWPKPMGLMQKIVAHWSKPGETVLDPHLGAGTTLRAAKDQGRKAIGIEIEERFCEIAAKSMAQEVLAL